MKLTPPFVIEPQPNDETCGPTSLHAVYNYLGSKVSLDEVIDSVNFLEDGGTLAVMLGIDALKRGFQATIITYNLKVFDPSWRDLSSAELIVNLEIQLTHKTGQKFLHATRAYQEFLELGGKITFDDLTPDLLSSYFSRNIPVLAGLSATYLYRSKREYYQPKKGVVYDDMRGVPSGHFVVLCGLQGNRIMVSDPYKDNPVNQSHYYKVDVNHLIHSVLLGIVTYDANLLIVSSSH